jgi:ribosomal protein S18 acetylase RimI-like enzyme
VFIAVENQTVVGFVSVSLNTKKMYKKFMIQSSFKLLPYMINKLFSMTFWHKILETLNAPFVNNQKDKDKDSFAELPELLSIVVDSKVQAKGIGTMLLSEMENQLKKIGIFDYKVVVGSNLELANKFYKKMVLNLKVNLNYIKEFCHIYM